jgi:hypothetical protein
MGNFKVRSVERDRETDRQRLSRVQHAITAARQDAARELAGLKKRQEQELLLLSVRFGELEDYGQRSTEDERSLGNAERVAMRAMARISELEHEIAQFDEMLGGIASRLRASSPAAQPGP